MVTTVVCLIFLLKLKWPKNKCLRYGSEAFKDKVIYLVLFSLIDNRNINNLQFLPESFGFMLEYWYIERGLSSVIVHSKSFHLHK